MSELRFANIMNKSCHHPPEFVNRLEFDFFFSILQMKVSGLYYAVPTVKISRAFAILYYGFHLVIYNNFVLIPTTDSTSIKLVNQISLTANFGVFLGLNF